MQLVGHFKQNPDMLPVLKKAGVVDAGCKGLIYVLRGFTISLPKKKCQSPPEANAGEPYKKTSQSPSHKYTMTTRVSFWLLHEFFYF